MNQIRRFMYGRYGFDQYTRALIFLSLFFSLIGTLTRFMPVLFLAYIPFIYGIYRTVSRNISKRSQENLRYSKMTGHLKNSLNKIKLACIGTKTHKYYKCTHCKQTIRVPRDKGKIRITCPKCKTEFIRRT